MKKFILILTATLVFSITPGLSQNWNIQLISTLNLPGGTIKGIAQNGNYAYIAAGTAGLKIIDISNPEQMSQISNLSGIGTVNEIFYYSGYVYLETTPTAFKIVDVSVPSNPVIVNIMTLGGAIRATDAERQLAYFRTNDGPGLIMDISSPQFPTAISSFWATYWGFFMDLAVEGNYLYTISQVGSDEFDYWCDTSKVFDVADPLNPTYLNGWYSEKQVQDIEIDRQLLYLCTYSTDLTIFDISNPANPVAVSNLQVAGSPDGIKASRGFAYLRCPNYGAGMISLLIADFIDPSNPIITGYYNTPSTIVDLVFVQDYVFLVENNSIWSFKCDEALGGGISLNIEPLITPIQIPVGGGSFDYNLTVNNDWIGSQELDIWTEVVLPSGSLFEPAEQRTVVIADSSSRELLLTQDVPSRAPAGEYTFIVHAGHYPNELLASDSLSFTKLAADSRITGDSEYSTILTQKLPFQVSPNPFNNSTTITFDLPEAGEVKLSVYDIAGREVQSLVIGHLSLGAHQVVWDAEGVSSGLYFLRLETAGSIVCGKMLLIK